MGGITNGHWEGFEPWLDVYDPATGDWQMLPDAPHARDHFQSVVVDDRLYAAGGRTTWAAEKKTFALTVQPVDVFDFATGAWLVEHDVQLPTPRAGSMTLAWGGAVVVGGGQSGTQKTAHDEVEAYDPATDTWRSWPAFVRGRRGSGFAVVDGFLYVASGSGNRGGSPELPSLERLKLPDLVDAAGAGRPVAAAVGPTRLAAACCAAGD